MTTLPTLNAAGSLTLASDSDIAYGDATTLSAVEDGDTLVLDDGYGVELTAISDPVDSTPPAAVINFTLEDLWAGESGSAQGYVFASTPSADELPYVLSAVAIGTLAARATYDAYPSGTLYAAVDGGTTVYQLRGDPVAWVEIATSLPDLTDAGSLTLTHADDIVTGDATTLANVDAGDTLVVTGYTVSGVVATDAVSSSLEPISGVWFRLSVPWSDEIGPVVADAWVVEKTNATETPGGVEAVLSASKIGAFSGRSAYDSEAAPFRYCATDGDGFGAPAKVWQRQGATGNWVEYPDEGRAVSGNVGEDLGTLSASFQDIATINANLSVFAGETVTTALSVTLTAALTAAQPRAAQFIVELDGVIIAEVRPTFRNAEFEPIEVRTDAVWIAEDTFENVQLKVRGRAPSGLTIKESASDYAASISIQKG